MRCLGPYAPLIDVPFSVPPQEDLQQAFRLPVHSEASAQSSSQKPKHKVERLGVGAIGLRYQGSVIAHKAQMYGDIVAVCDVDKNVRDPVKSAFGSTPRDFERLPRSYSPAPTWIVVTIGTPDHWHTKMIIDACRAGKDVYCEKPLTLTIDEGKLLRDVVKATGRVVQVGSWQRSDHRFRQAVEMVRQGRIGKLTNVDIVLGKNKTGDRFSSAPCRSTSIGIFGKGKRPMCRTWRNGRTTRFAGGTNTQEVK